MSRPKWRKGRRSGSFPGTLMLPPILVTLRLTVRVAWGAGAAKIICWLAWARTCWFARKTGTMCSWTGQTGSYSKFKLFPSLTACWQQAQLRRLQMQKAMFDGLLVVVEYFWWCSNGFWWLFSPFWWCLNGFCCLWLGSVFLRVFGQTGTFFGRISSISSRDLVYFKGLTFDVNRRGPWVLTNTQHPDSPSWTQVGLLGGQGQGNDQIIQYSPMIPTKKNIRIQT